MMLERLEESDVREILSRAEEIYGEEQLEVELGPHLQELVRSAEEAGLSRTAVTQALRERMSALLTPLDPGELVFAPSEDDRLYAAECIEVERGYAKVRFLGGADVKVSLTDLRPFQMLPGHRVRAPWPSWGWWTCTVISYERENRKVRVTDNWGSEQTFHLSDIYVEPVKPSSSMGHLKTTVWLAAATMGGLIGTGVGAVISWLILR